jgi:anti-anti-sigma factor
MLCNSSTWNGEQVSLHTERRGDVAVVAPHGPLDGGKLTKDLETEMRKLIYDDQKKILLDMGNVSRVSSLGIGALTGAHISATKRDVKLHVCNVDKRIKDILVIVKLINVLNVFDKCEEALAAFQE